MTIPRVVEVIYCASPFGPSGSWDGPAYEACGFWAHPLGYAILAVIVASVVITAAAIVCLVKRPSFEIVFAGAFATLFAGAFWFIAIGLFCAALVPSVLVGSLVGGKRLNAVRLARRRNAQCEADAKMRLVDEWLAAPSEHGRDGEAGT